MKCSICQCETDFTRYKVLAKDGHRWTWGRLCAECYEDGNRKQKTLAEGACIPPPAPPPSKTVDTLLTDIEHVGWELKHVQAVLEEVEAYLIHTQEGPSKPRPCDNGGE